MSEGEGGRSGSRKENQSEVKKIVGNSNGKTMAGCCIKSNVI